MSGCMLASFEIYNPLIVVLDSRIDDNIKYKDDNTSNNNDSSIHSSLNVCADLVEMLQREWNYAIYYQTQENKRVYYPSISAYNSNNSNNSENVFSLKTNKVSWHSHEILEFLDDARMAMLINDHDSLLFFINGDSGFINSRIGIKNIAVLYCNRKHDFIEFNDIFDQFSGNRDNTLFNVPKLFFIDTNIVLSEEFDKNDKNDKTVISRGISKNKLFQLYKSQSAPGGKDNSISKVKRSKLKTAISNENIASEILTTRGCVHSRDNNHNTERKNKNGNSTPIVDGIGEKKATDHDNGISGKKESGKKGDNDGNGSSSKKDRKGKGKGKERSLSRMDLQMPIMIDGNICIITMPFEIVSKTLSSSRTSTINFATSGSNDSNDDNNNNKWTNWNLSKSKSGSNNSKSSSININGDTDNNGNTLQGQTYFDGTFYTKNYGYSSSSSDDNDNKDNNDDEKCNCNIKNSNQSKTGKKLRAMRAFNAEYRGQIPLKLHPFEIKRVSKSKHKLTASNNNININSSESQILAIENWTRTTPVWVEVTPIESMKQNTSSCNRNVNENDFGLKQREKEFSQFKQNISTLEQMNESEYFDFECIEAQQITTFDKSELDIGFRVTAIVDKQYTFNGKNMKIVKDRFVNNNNKLYFNGIYIKPQLAWKINCPSKICQKNINCNYNCKLVWKRISKDTRILMEKNKYKCYNYINCGKVFCDDNNNIDEKEDVKKQGFEKEELEEEEECFYQCRNIHNCNTLVCCDCFGQLAVEMSVKQQQASVSVTTTRSTTNVSVTTGGSSTGNINSSSNSSGSSRSSIRSRINTGSSGSGSNADEKKQEQEFEMKKDEYYDSLSRSTSQLLPGSNALYGKLQELITQLNGNSSNNGKKKKKEFWVLAMLKIYQFGELNNKHNHEIADKAIEILETAIISFCKYQNNIRIGFKDDIKGKGSQFAILIKCIHVDFNNNNNSDNTMSMDAETMHKTSQFVKETINEFIKQICILSSFGICVGISAPILSESINYNYNNSNSNFSDPNINDIQKDTMIEWRERALRSLEIAKEMGRNCYYWDEMELISNKLEYKYKYKEMLYKIVNTINNSNSNNSNNSNNKKSNNNNINNHWFLAIIDGDNVSKLRRKNEIDAARAMRLVANQVYNICNKYNNYNNKIECIGFIRGGDEFAIFIKHKKENVVKEILEKLRINVQNNCKVTISVGVTKFNIEKSESAIQWEERAEEGLKGAKKSGKNQVWCV